MYGKYQSQWFLNCGARTTVVVREGLQGGTRIRLLSVFLHKKYMCSYSFYLWGSVAKFRNFCVLSLLVFKNGHYNLSLAFCSCCICANSGFQTFDRMICGRLRFSGTRPYVATRDPRVVRDQKRFGNHCPKQTSTCLYDQPNNQTAKD